ncbi:MULTISPECIES: ParA family protein [Catellatospora]|uniref:ParA family protein n=1 Tax=Catellatospora TaxID=53365 RepID=UPI002482353A|nr:MULTISPECIES: ParA family protein [Catellatospora]
MSLPQGSYGVVSRETSTPAQRGAANPGSGMRPTVANTYSSSAAGSHPVSSGPASPDATGFRATASVPPPGSSVPPAEFSSAPHGATGYVPVSAPPANRPPSPRPQPSSTHVAGEDQSATAYGASDANTTASGSSEDPPLAMEAMRAVQILNPSGEVTMPRPTRQRVMCVANQKGGVGKTTTTVNLAVALALHGNRVLVVDLDPQGNASTGLNVPHHAGVPDVYDCLIDQVPMEEVAQAVEGIPNLYCVPATIDLAGAEIELVSVVARESRLGRAIQGFPMEFDYVFIDCPPSLGLLTVNALCAAQEVLIPIQCEYYALEGLNQLLNNINLVKAHLNPNLDVSTILLTMYDRRTRLADAVEQDVRNHFGEKVLTSVIPRNVRVSEAPSYGQSVMTYDPGSRGATSYFEAAQEIAERGAKIGVAA